MSFGSKLFKTFREWLDSKADNAQNEALLKECWLEARRYREEQMRRATDVLKGEMSSSHRITRAISILEE